MMIYSKESKNSSNRCIVSPQRRCSSLLDKQAVAEKLGVTINTLYAWVNQRRIPFVKVGRLLRFDEKDIDKWIEERKVAIMEY